MFDNVCTVCHRRQLIFPSQVTAVVDSEYGTLMAYTCWCGAEQVWLAGKDAEQPAASA